MTVFGIPNCNTVKKAQEWLKANKLNYDFHDFKKKGATVEMLKRWFEAFGWEKVLNKNGLTFRNLVKSNKQKLTRQIGRWPIS